MTGMHTVPPGAGRAARGQGWHPAGGGLGLGLLFFIVVAAALTLSPEALSHEGGPGAHADPELLGSLETQVHLLIQWVHLVAFGLWFGGAGAALLLDATDLPLHRLLHVNWFLLLLLLGSGSYNMEMSGALPNPPDLFNLGVNRAWDFGASYTWLMAAKLLLYAAAVLLTLTVSLAGWRKGAEEAPERSRRPFLVGQTLLASLLVVVTAGVLLLHEAADLSPTPLHSLGGVAGPRGEGERVGASRAGTAAPEPYRTRRTKGWDAGLRLLGDPRASLDLGGRAAHLAGFGLWLGLLGVGLMSRSVSAARFLRWAWALLALQALTGVYGMTTWAPFDRAPYLWRLGEMAHYRFGWTYTALMGAKHALVAGVVVLLGVLARRRVRERGALLAGWERGLVGVMFLLTLALAYVMVAVLLVHEGVDHAL